MQAVFEFCIKRLQRVQLENHSEALRINILNLLRLVLLGLEV